TPVVQGPESLEPELIQLDFVNAGPGVWSSGSAAAGEAIDSGIGPYSLSRLCRDAGGEYFAVPVSFSGAETLFGGTSAVGGTTYDRAVLRRYAPLYLPEEGYRKLTAENKALAALVEAARLPRVDPRFDWPSEFMPSEENRFRRALDEAQQPPARLMPRIDKLYETLKAGEPDRDRLTEPRWQAGYDLAMGRAMAAKVRTESFIAMLAVMKQGKSFADPKSTAWMIERADEISVGSALDRLRQRAGECLQRVAREHPGTPWADLAKRELSVPMGWRWGEK
ncbi:MAG: VWA domain-containing protein, partial [Planctomycetes bacterium]|nr:VWA domain-containing protein [Planctomycetota bacterium]